MIIGYNQIIINIIIASIKIYMLHLKIGTLQSNSY